MINIYKLFTDNAEQQSWQLLQTFAEDGAGIQAYLLSLSNGESYIAECIGEVP